jgi:hypothetical protein
MDISLSPFFAIWLIIAIVVVVLIFYRRRIARNEDDSLHLGATAGVVAQSQSTISTKLDQVDKWGKLLTIVAAIYGVILLAVYFFQYWVQSSRMGV